MPSLGLQHKSIEFSKLIFVAATLINEKNMQKKKTILNFFLFKLSSIDIAMMTMEVKSVSRMHDEAESKQAGRKKCDVL